MMDRSFRHWHRCPGAVSESSATARCTLISAGPGGKFGSGAEIRVTERGLLPSRGQVAACRSDPSELESRRRLGPSALQSEEPSVPRGVRVTLSPVSSVDIRVL